MGKAKLGIESLAVHGPARPHVPGAPLSGEVVLSTSFHIAADTGFSASSLGDDPPPVYTRWGNPTVQRLERHLAALEEAESALCFASGMAAISALFSSLLSAGDHIVASNICYAGVAELMHDSLPRLGIACSFVDSSDAAAVAAAIRPETKLIYVETPANPILRLTDLVAVAGIAKRAGVKLAVDSTFATPIATRPLTLGADFVIHSLTKYACGHGDTLGGVVLGSHGDLGPMRSALVHAGAVLHPLAAVLIERSLHTLPLRMREHAANALAVAQFLESAAGVELVRYPGLPSHPQHALAQRQMANHSGMIAFRARDARRVQLYFEQKAKLISYAVSLGKSKTVVVLIETDEVQRQSFRLPPSELEKYRSIAGDGLFRLSVGLESQSDLIAELDAALGG